MRVRMKTQMAGPDGSAAPGDVVDIADAQALAMISAGFAEAADAPRSVEEAVIAVPERAVTRKRRIAWTRW